jgi:hypothetical protein
VYIVRVRVYVYVSVNVNVFVYVWHGVGCTRVKDRGRKEGREEVVVVGMVDKVDPKIVAFEMRHAQPYHTRERKGWGIEERGEMEDDIYTVTCHLRLKCDIFYPFSVDSIRKNDRSINQSINQSIN